MELEYIGELLSDGHLSVKPSVVKKLKQGEKVKIKIQMLPNDLKRSMKNREKSGQDAATKRILNRMKNAPSLGRIQGTLSREEIYEDRLDERY